MDDEEFRVTYYEAGWITVLKGTPGLGEELILDFCSEECTSNYFDSGGAY